MLKEKPFCIGNILISCNGSRYECHIDLTHIISPWAKLHFACLDIKWIVLHIHMAGTGVLNWGHPCDISSRVCTNHCISLLFFNISCTITVNKNNKNEHYITWTWAQPCFTTNCFIVFTKYLMENYNHDLLAVVDGEHESTLSIFTAVYNASSKAWKNCLKHYIMIYSQSLK